MNKFLQIFILKIFFLFLPFFVPAQTPEVEWQRTIGGQNNDVLTDAALLPDSSLVILASTWSCDGTVTNYHGMEDILITKIDQNGSIQWTKTLGGSEDDHPVQLKIDGNVIYVLCRSSSNDGDFSFVERGGAYLSFIYLLDFNGNTLFDFHAPYPNGLSVNRAITLPCIPLKLEINEMSHRAFLYSKGTYPLHDEFKSYWVGPNISGLFNIIDRTPYQVQSFNNDLFEVKDYFHDNFSFLYAGNTTSPLISLKCSDFSQKIALQPFHSESEKKGMNQTTNDIWVLKVNEPVVSKNKITFISKCIGGKLDESVIKFTKIKDNCYRLIASSDSKDGDFKINYGFNDIWLLDLDENFNVKKSFNIGTKQNDLYNDGCLIEKDLWAYLINSTGYDKTTSEPATLLTSNNDSSGLKLILVNETGISQRLNFNLTDSNARMWSINNKQLVISADKKTNDNIDADLICIDAGQGKILWEKILGGNSYDHIAKVLPANDGSLFAIGTTKRSNSGTVGQNNGEDDIWIVKLNQKEKIKKAKTTFNDNLNDSKTSSASDTTAAIVDTQIKALFTFENDTSNLNSLWQFAQTSEYLADYDLAAKAYSIIISKLDKVKDKAQISKARAHQITCNFLSQSEKSVSKESAIASIESQNGYYGIGINYRVISNHLMINNVIKEKNAEQAGVKSCDEIIAINDNPVTDDCLTSAKVKEKLRGEKDAYVNISVKRFGNKNLLDFKLQRTFIASNSNNAQPAISNKENNNATVNKEMLNTKQEQTQNFLKKFVASIQKDSSLMKDIEIARKVSYALTILNKWANEPVSNKYLLQIDEQLGMVSSLISVIKGNNPNFNFDNNGKVSFANPDLKELVSKDYAKEAQSKFDSIAHTQPIKETKIDNNITFIEKNNLESFSGEYQCDAFLEMDSKMTETRNQTSNSNFPRTGDCWEANKKYVDENSGPGWQTINWNIDKPLQLSIKGNSIQTIRQSEAYSSGSSTSQYTKNFESHVEFICECNGEINGTKALLKGNCKTNILASTANSGSSFVTSEISEEIDLSNPEYIIIKSVSNQTANQNSRSSSFTIKYVKIK